VISLAASIWPMATRSRSKQKAICGHRRAVCYPRRRTRQTRRTDRYYL